jgi:hypothetical protein
MGLGKSKGISVTSVGGKRVVFVSAIATDHAGRPLYCSICGEQQKTTPSGDVCLRGHGGVEGVTTPPRKAAARGRSLVETVTAYAGELGLVVPGRPQIGEEALELPWQIDTVPSSELGRLYGQFSAMATYAAVHVGLADVARSESKYRLTIVSAETTLQSNGSNAAERKAAVELDEQVMQAAEVHRLADARYVFLASLLQGYERSIATISREFSRRGLDLK